MTNLEALKQLIGGTVRLSDEKLSAALILQGLDPEATYDVADKCKIYGMAISEIKKSKGVSKITESGYSIEFSDPTNAATIYELAKESGCEQLITDNQPLKPTITNISNRW